MTLRLSHMPNDEDTELARINADGTVFYRWELIERLACEWQPFDRDIARCIAKLLLPLKPTERSDRAERILAALREPSEAVWKHAYDAYWSSWDGEDMWTVIIRTAVAAAEKEVGG